MWSTVRDDGRPAPPPMDRGRPRRRPRGVITVRAGLRRRWSSVRIVVADDVVAHARGHHARTRRDGGHEVVGKADDVASLLAAVADHEPDVAVVDIKMPPTHTDEGLVAAQRIRTEHPDVGVWCCPSISSRATRCACWRTTRGGRLPAEGARLRRLCARRGRPPCARGRDGRGPDDRVEPLRPAPPRGPDGRPEPPRTGGVGARRRGPLQPGHRREAGRHRPHRRGAHDAHLPQARLDESPASHRRVLAVLSYLRACSLTPRRPGRRPLERAGWCGDSR